MKKIKSVLLVLLWTTVLNAQQKSSTVFSSGKDGYATYRIPAIIGLPNGDLLAFAEGRVNGSNDFGDINIVAKRSHDKGLTWTALQTVADVDSLQAGNPSPVVDLTDPAYPKGRIILFYNTGNNHENEVRKGNGLREVWYITSTDNGHSWSKPVNITTQTHRPNQPAIKPDYNFKEDWRSYANTPGHAIQFSDGRYKGRIFVAANHSAGDPKADATDYSAHGFYSDDHCATFRIGATVGRAGSNESMAAILGNGKLMMNSRNQRADTMARIVSVSSDGGASWDTTYIDNNLPDPICQGSILTVGNEQGKAIVAFCNAASKTHRDSLTLRISYDDGSTWRRSYLLDKGVDKGEEDATAYSDLVKLSANEIGVLYERKDYTQIVFMRVKWK
ncbi:sialidase family protein [Ferruginibacter paludis]|uniref:sialidase family protein n=1 Tax=Ferruginibacter paludis TaxID=1310417 RepID=UPI0025B4179D|nr:sialidase family protein [Ferruginibacter paludis]MDN3659217.1 sialidase family protein [Ferruginibacter paludis]